MQLLFMETVQLHYLIGRLQSLHSTLFYSTLMYCAVPHLPIFQHTLVHSLILYCTLITLPSSSLLCSTFLISSSLPSTVPLLSSTFYFNLYTFLSPFLFSPFLLSPLLFFFNLFSFLLSSPVCFVYSSSSIHYFGFILLS